MVKAHFKDIHLQIIYQIKNAQSDIKICVAWFTDFEIYETLVNRLKEGVAVEVIIANHIFNKESRVDFKELLNHNGKVGYVGNLSDGSKDSFMHNKFCIIDNEILITGSYNWSYKARKNDENILIIKDNKSLINQFKEKFNELKPKYAFSLKNNKVKLLPIEKIMAKWEKNYKTKKSSKITGASSIFKKF